VTHLLTPLYSCRLTPSNVFKACVTASCQVHMGHRLSLQNFHMVTRPALGMLAACSALACSALQPCSPAALQPSSPAAQQPSMLSPAQPLSIGSSRVRSCSLMCWLASGAVACCKHCSITHYDNARGAMAWTPFVITSMCSSCTSYWGPRASVAASMRQRVKHDKPSRTAWQQSAHMHT
jgi:hypothetical protein